MVETSSQQTIPVFQDLLKTSWRGLQRNNFSSSKTSSRCFQDAFARCLPNSSSRRLEENVLKKTSCLQNVFFKTSWRRLQEDFKKTPCKHVFKTYATNLQHVFTKANFCWCYIHTKILRRNLNGNEESVSL